MELYNRDNTCTKCGHELSDDKYIPSFAVTDRMRTPDRIARTCRNCKFVWHEAPLDARQPSQLEPTNK